MVQKNPLVTVLMPVYNGEKYLKEAIESILNQEFTDFEFLIINDGSTDNSVDIIQSYKDPRIRLVQNKKNLGVAATLNRGIDLAKGEFLARMDCDDISHLQRLKKQIDFMLINPNIGLSGTWVELFNENISGKVLKYPLTHEEIKAGLFFKSEIAHASIVLRLNEIKENKLYYNPNFKIAEDYDLWIRSQDKILFGNIPEILYKIRVRETGLYRSQRDLHPEIYYEIDKNNLAALGIEIQDVEKEMHRAIMKLSFTNIKCSQQFLHKVNVWLQKIHEMNTDKQVFIEPMFSDKLAFRWFWGCYKCKRLGLFAVKEYKKSNLRKYAKISLYDRLKFHIISFYFQLRNIFGKKKIHKSLK